jgi:hypothetical protein
VLGREDPLYALERLELERLVVLGRLEVLERCPALELRLPDAELRSSPLLLGRDVVAARLPAPAPAP